MDQCCFRASQVRVGNADRSAGWQHGDLQRPRGLEGGARPSRGAWPQGLRRHLSAGHQGACRSRQDEQPGTGSGDDRPPGASRDRGNDGAEPRWHVPCRNTRRCQESQGPCSGCVSLRHQEHDDASVVIAALKEQFPDIQGPKKDDICYATQNRQDAVKALAEQCDLVIVVGNPNSSNSRRLKEVAIARGIAGHLIDGPDEIDPEWLAGRRLTSPSTPPLRKFLSEGRSTASAS